MFMESHLFFDCFKGYGCFELLVEPLAQVDTPFQGIFHLIQFLQWSNSWAQHT